MWGVSTCEVTRPAVLRRGGVPGTVEAECPQLCGTSFHSTLKLTENFTTVHTFHPCVEIKLTGIVHL